MSIKLQLNPIETGLRARTTPVSKTRIMQKKNPRFGSETLAPSPRETTARARAPRWNRRGQQRCMGSFPRVDPVLGSRVGARVF